VDPGALALVGASAFFGGVSRLTVALTVIMLEITNDVRFLLPIMLSVMVAKWTADSVTHPLYHAIIELKCLPFLSPDVALHAAQGGALETHQACELLDRAAPVRTVPLQGACGALARTLLDSAHGAYPAVSAEGHFVGAVTRRHLLAALQAAASGRNCVLSHEELSAPLVGGPAAQRGLLEQCLEPRRAALQLDLASYNNASAFAVRADFSLHRAYLLFRTMGLRHLFLTDAANRVVGVLTRKDLMDYRLHAVLHPHGHEHDDPAEDNLLTGPSPGKPVHRGEVGQELASMDGSPTVVSERRV
jgi:chloride channel 7